MKKLLVFAFTLIAFATRAQEVPNHQIPIGRGAGVIGFGSVNCTALGSFTQASASVDPICTLLAGTGVGAKIATASGSLTNGHCVSIDANGDFIDAGGACTTGGGGGTVNAGTANNLAYYVTSTNAVSGLANGTTGLPLVEGAPPSWAALSNAGLATMNAHTAKCNNTGSSAAPTDCSSIIVNDFTSLATSKWFSNDSPPANFIAYGDKQFGGDFINNPNTATSASNIYSASCSTGDWFSNFEATTSNLNCGYWPSFALVVAAKNVTTGFPALNPASGVLGAGQTKNNNFGGAFGIAGFAVNNNVNSGTTGPAGAGGAWAAYLECDQTVNSPSAGCFAAELEAGNFVSDAFSLPGSGVSPDPFQQAHVNGNQIGCGSGLATPTPFKCAAGIQILDVGNQFRTGINIFNGSIVSQTLFGGPLSPAMTLPPSYGIVWYTAANTAEGGIDMDGSGNFNIVATHLQMNGTAAVSCPAGTVNQVTFTVTNGIVTHC